MTVLAPTVSLLVVLGMFVFLVALGLFVLIVYAMRRPSNPGDAEAEARLMQEIHQALERLESRVEVLETVLLEEEAPKKVGGRTDGEGSTP
jgi:phage shock protein B